MTFFRLCSDVGPSSNQPVGWRRFSLKGLFLFSKHVIPVMAANGGGSIINISSIGGSVPDISQIGYGTSKAAINYLTKLIATQLPEITSAAMPYSRA